LQIHLKRPAADEAADAESNLEKKNMNEKKDNETLNKSNAEVRRLTYAVLDYADGQKEDYFHDVSEVAAEVGGAVPEFLWKYLIKTTKSVDKTLALKSEVPTNLLTTTMIQSRQIIASVIDGMGKRGCQIFTPEEGKPDIDDRFVDLNPGYKGFAIRFVRESDPLVRELQLFQPAMFEAKEAMIRH